MKKFWLILLLFAFVATASNQAHAQVNFKVGPRLTLALGDIADEPLDGSFAIGGDVRAETIALPVNFHGNFDYYFVDDLFTVFAIDLNAVYPFGIDNQVFTPYAGGGIGITSLSIDEDVTGGFDNDDTDVALNIVGGAEFPLQSLTPFVQAQFSVGGDFDRFGLTGGILFNL